MYTVNEMSDEPIMLLDKHIGFDSEDGQGIDGALFQQELLRLDSMGKKRIQVWINSPGGTVVDGFNIYNAILKSKTKVDTYCMGIAASIAGVIFQAGRNRIMADYGILMYHNPFGGENSDGLEAMRNSINTMISQRSGMNSEDVERMMNRETFIMPDEALRIGMCDKIECSVDFNKKRAVPVVNDSKTYWKQSGKILNNIFKKPTMIKVTNKLKLNAEASEDAIFEAITLMENSWTIQNKASQDAIDKLKADMEEAENKFKETRDAYEKCKNELAAAQNKIKIAEDAAVEEKAKNMVSGYAKTGRIKNDEPTIAKWVSQAKNNFDATKELLESLPLNKKAESIVEIDNGGKTPGYSMALSMVEITNKVTSKK